MVSQSVSQSVCQHARLRGDPADPVLAEKVRHDGGRHLRESAAVNHL